MDTDNSTILAPSIISAPPESPPTNTANDNGTASAEIGTSSVVVQLTGDDLKVKHLLEERNPETEPDSTEDAAAGGGKKNPYGVEGTNATVFSTPTEEQPPQPYELHKIKDPGYNDFK